MSHTSRHFGLGHFMIMKCKNVKMTHAMNFNNNYKIIVTCIFSKRV